MACLGQVECQAARARVAEAGVADTLGLWAGLHDFRTAWGSWSGGLEVVTTGIRRVTISSGQCCTNGSSPAPVGPVLFRPASFCSTHGSIPVHCAVLLFRVPAAGGPCPKTNPVPQIIIWTVRGAEKHANRRSSALIVMESCLSRYRRDLRVLESPNSEAGPTDRQYYAMYMRAPPAQYPARSLREGTYESKVMRSPAGIPASVASRAVGKPRMLGLSHSARPHQCATVERGSFQPATID